MHVKIFLPSTPDLHLGIAPCFATRLSPMFACDTISLYNAAKHILLLHMFHIHCFARIHNHADVGVSGVYVK